VGKFCHLVEKNGTPISHLKVTLAAVGSPCKRTLFVPKQLGVNSTLGNSTTVNGYVVAMLACAKLVYYLRKNFLPCAALTGNKHRQVGRSNLAGYVNSPV